MKTVPMERKPLKPIKDTDSYARARVLGIYVRVFPGLALLGLVLYGLLGVVAAAFVSGIVTIIVMFISDRIGGGAVDTLFGLGRKSQSLRKQLTADLDQARYHKMQNEFQQALQTVNVVLEQDPDFPDALFLKAQVLWDGFKNSAGAKRYLTKVMKVVSNKDEPIHHWASSYFDELTGMERRKQTRFSERDGILISL
jgi:hypothetical protein